MNAPTLVTVHGAVARIRRNGRILLLQRRSDDRSFPLKWCLPGGKLDPEEVSIDAVIREVFEETGLRARRVTLLGIESSDAPHLGRRFVIACFDMQVEDDDDVSLSDEHIDVSWDLPERAQTRDLAGRVTRLLIEHDDPFDHG